MVSSTLRIRHPSVAWLGPPWGGFLAMQKFTMKLWTIAAGAAAATTLAAPPALAHPEDEVVIASPSDFVYPTDPKSVVSGKSVAVRLDLGGRRIIKKKKKT